MRTTDMTLEMCIATLRKMANAEVAYIDEIPGVLKEDFNNFIVGHTIGEHNGRAITYDLPTYIDKILYKKGIDYPVSWGVKI